MQSPHLAQVLWLLVVVERLRFEVVLVLGHRMRRTHPSAAVAAVAAAATEATAASAPAGDVI